ncbi:MAG: glycoside hydrolase family 97 protein [Reichenbachiella sp.]
MKYIIAFYLIASVGTYESSSQSFSLTSPNNLIKLNIEKSDSLYWSVSFKNEPLIEKTSVAVTLNDQLIPNQNDQIIDDNTEHNSNKIRPVVSHKNSIIIDDYKSLSLRFENNYSIQFRAYNEGVAYRFLTNFKDSLIVNDESMNIQLPENTLTFFPEEESMYSHNERTYLKTRLDSIPKQSFCSLPIMFNINDSVKVLFSETDLYDYPGLFLEKSTPLGLKTKFPKYVLETKPNDKSSPDRNVIITKKANYIAKTNGTRSFPWRVFIISDQDATFINSSLLFQLATPHPKSEDFSWVKPGRVAWDWYNANNIYDVDFDSGINTKTYKYYIDFASKYGIEYIILDEGWTKSTTEILESNSDIDIPELVRYGQQKNVELILWVLWKPLNDNMEQILDKYQSWGAKGIKADFMQRSDQYMVNSYEEIAKQCAKRKLLVDFHGAFKPSGLRRAYPNVINYEGVKGNENNKWSTDANPEHNVTIPFIRMAAGPMDYTPGALRNANKENHRISHFRPMSLGTRCHQAAMYVVYESPLQMYCDAPSTYLKDEKTIKFISQIPSTWDETIVLDAEISNYISLARRKNDKWYIGAMTDWTHRELSIDFSFLSKGQYEIEIMKDGINAEKFAEDFVIEKMKVDQKTMIDISLASGGGWVGIISKK